MKSLAVAIKIWVFGGKSCEDGASFHQNQYKTSNKNKESLL
jgi:hypothetical protein